MADPAGRRATYQDILEAPAHKVAEIVDGVLHVSPRRAKPHALAASALGGELIPPFRRGRGGPGGWFILDEPELHLDADVVVPDLAGWRCERMPVLTVDEPYFTLVPDWICEVLSPSTAKLDRPEKLPIYERAEVRHAWLVDPVLRTLEVLRLERERWTLLDTYHDDARVRAEPFEVFELELDVCGRASSWPSRRADPPGAQADRVTRSGSVLPNGSQISMHARAGPVRGANADDLVAASRRLRDLSHMREHFIAGDQLSTPSRTLGLHERIVQLGQVRGGKLDLVVVEAVDQMLDQLGALLDRHAERFL